MIQILQTCIEMLNDDTHLVVFVTDGCGRTPATPRPTTVAPVSSTAAFQTHRKPCTFNETIAQGCLNGGSCFALEIEEGHERTTHCQ